MKPFHVTPHHPADFTPFTVTAWNAKRAAQAAAWQLYRASTALQATGPFHGDGLYEPVRVLGGLRAETAGPRFHVAAA